MVMNEKRAEYQFENIGSRVTLKVLPSKFPNADDVVRQRLLETPKSDKSVDVMDKQPLP